MFFKSAKVVSAASFKPVTYMYCMHHRFLMFWEQKMSSAARKEEFPTRIAHVVVTRQILFILLECIAFITFYRAPSLQCLEIKGEMHFITLYPTVTKFPWYVLLVNVHFF